MTAICDEVQAELFAMRDMEYRDFHARLMPTIDKEKIIGVRTPQLRKYAREFFKKYNGKSELQEFLSALPHAYYDENNLHGFLIEQIRDYDSCMREVERFLPYIDNWATCDMLSPKIFAKNTKELTEAIERWLSSGETYTIRFGVNMLMRFYLDEKFDMAYPERLAAIRSEEYYVKMVIAWYFATALAKQYDAILPFIEKQSLDIWTHNKAIQKACESYRITAEQKGYLKTLKIKN